MSTERPIMDGQKGSNVINVSIARRPGFFTFLSKQLLKEHQVVELHSIGRAMEVNLRVSRLLEASGYATFVALHSTKVMVNMGERQIPKPKLIVKITKADSFESKMAEWEEVVKFNKEQAEKNKGPTAGQE